MTAHKDRRATQRVITALRKEYGACSVKARREPLEELLLGVLTNGTGARKATAAMDAILESFVDLNETRVASATEVAGVLEDIDEASEKAAVIKQVLNNLYSATGEMSLEAFREGEPYETLVLMENVENFPESALARATLLALEHSVLPLTPNVLAVCQRIGMLTGRSDLHYQTRQIEKLVPKNDMFEFHWLASHHAAATCLQDGPQCATCCLRRSCRTGKKASAKKASRTTTNRKKKT